MSTINNIIPAYIALISIKLKKAYQSFSINTWKFGAWCNFSYSEQNEYFCMNGSCQKVWCMSVKKVPYITPWPLLHMAWNRLDRLLFLKKSMDNNPKQHEPSYWELSFSCYCNLMTLPSSTSICWQYSANTGPDETYDNLSNWFHAMWSGGHGTSLMSADNGCLKTTPWIIRWQK
jgi:hypothetical protein